MHPKSPGAITTAQTGIEPGTRFICVAITATDSNNTSRTQAISDKIADKKDTWRSRNSLRAMSEGLSPAPAYSTLPSTSLNAQATGVAKNWKRQKAGEYTEIFRYFCGVSNPAPASFMLPLTSLAAQGMHNGDRKKNGESNGNFEGIRTPHLHLLCCRQRLWQHKHTQDANDDATNAYVSRGGLREHSPDSRTDQEANRERADDETKARAPQRRPHEVGHVRQGDDDR